VDVVTDGRRCAAVREPDGWWSGPVLARGQDYALSIDGGPARPDPRSRWQPQGVHGPSRWLEASPFGCIEWFRQVPLADAVIYELHVGTFSREGTFTGAIEYLPQLVELGVTHVELMPVAQFAGTHGWGYDGVDLFAPHAAYGGPTGLRELIRACHTHGLAVIIDVVHNHLGPEGGYLAEFGPYLTSTHRTPWGDAVNLDADGSREVRRFLIDSALMWLRDYGADGLRLDAIHNLKDTRDRHFLAELSSEVEALSRAQERPLVLIGEWDSHDPIAVMPRDAGGWGLDAHWNDDFHHALHVLLTGERSGYFGDFGPGSLARVLQHGYALDGGYSEFRKAPHGKPFGELTRDRLVAYTQSHDQIGNRANGERLVHLCGPDRARIAAALLFASPFVPMLFQGEEWAASTPFCYFADPSDPGLREAIRAGRKAEHAHTTEVILDPIGSAARDRCVLPWAERAEGPHADMLRWYRDLIALRRTEPSLRVNHAYAARATEERGLLTVERGELLLACNTRPEPAPLVLEGNVVLASTGLASHTELPPLSCALLRR
jgi:maltooligosyltrehalose trehalohydrolase